MQLSTPHGALGTLSNSNGLGDLEAVLSTPHGALGTVSV